MAVVFSERLCSQIAQKKLEEYKDTNYVFDNDWIQNSMSGMDVDLSVATLRTLFNGIPDTYKDDEKFGLTIRVFNTNKNVNNSIIQFNADSSTNVYFGMEIDVNDNGGVKIFTLSMDVNMNGMVWYNYKSMDFKSLKFIMTNSKVLTTGITHTSASDMFYSAVGNFIENYFAD